MTTPPHSPLKSTINHHPGIGRRLWIGGGLAAAGLTVGSLVAVRFRGAARSTAKLVEATESAVYRRVQMPDGGADSHLMNARGAVEALGRIGPPDQLIHLGGTDRDLLGHLISHDDGSRCRQLH